MKIELKTEVNNMEKTTTKRQRWARLARQDPGELWMDASIDPYVLVRIDRLEIAPELVRLAEYPELANRWIHQLPEVPEV